MHLLNNLVTLNFRTVHWSPALPLKTPPLTQVWFKGDVPVILDSNVSGGQYEMAVSALVKQRLHCGHMAQRKTFPWFPCDVYRESLCSKVVLMVCCKQDSNESPDTFLVDLVTAGAKLIEWNSRLANVVTTRSIVVGHSWRSQQQTCWAWNDASCTLTVIVLVLNCSRSGSSNNFARLQRSV